MPANRWNDADANGPDDVDSLVYRSRLIGADPTLVNYGGGNTSTKTITNDHAGRPVETLWIKGSGSDLASIDRAGFTPLRLTDVQALAERESMTDEAMVDYLSRSMLDPRAPRASIETLLHAFVPAPNVDHTHADAALAFCCAARGEEIAHEVFGDEIAWVPYVRPGFALAQRARDALARNPDACALFLAKHGLVTWGQTARESYERTIEILTRCQQYIDDQVDAERPFGDRTVDPAPADQRRALFARILPRVRGIVSRYAAQTPFAPPRMILHWDDADDVLDFVDASAMPALAGTGAACPDHVMYTKFRPLALPAEASRGAAANGDTEALEAALAAAIDEYVGQYTRYYEAHRGAEGPEMLDPAPRVILIPGLGLIAAGPDAWAAANTAALYHRAIAVMRGAHAIDRFVSLTEAEAFAVEYWPLELYKLSLRPPGGELTGRIALITGGAGGIGRATARRFLEEGAHVVLADIDGVHAEAAAEELCTEFGRRRAVSVRADARDEADTDAMIDTTSLAYGGIDIAVANAGVATAHPIEETTLEEWERVHDVLTRGYFLTCRAAFRILRRQGLGGALVLNSSKNGLAAGKNALPYTTAKAAELHMARCLAEEGGSAGIRVNAVAPDAIIRESGLWTREWKEERARAYGFDVDQLEEYYRQRTTLKINVTARDVAEAMLFLVSDRSRATTGCVITVDGGVAVAYPR